MLIHYAKHHILQKLHCVWKAAVISTIIFQLFFYSTDKVRTQIDQYFYSDKVWHTNQPQNRFRSSKSQKDQNKINYKCRAPILTERSINSKKQSFILHCCFKIDSLQGVKWERAGSRCSWGLEREGKKKKQAGVISSSTEVTILWQDWLCLLYLSKWLPKVTQGLTSSLGYNF